MRQTYITTMPDKCGAFLKATRLISSFGGNIVRVSYNKAIDMHTLFIEVEVEEAGAKAITQKLSEIGYLSGKIAKSNVIMAELVLKDEAGSILPVLEKIAEYNANISYMNSEEDGSGFQHFKMGILIEHPSIIKALLDEVSKLCDIRIIDYSMTEKMLDNTVFYVSFTNEMRSLLSLDQRTANEFMINSNRIMQLLDEKNEAPLKTFDYIRRFAKFVVEHKGEGFNAGLSCLRISDRVTMHMIEPPCGCNTYILDDGKELLFIDCGFACYEREMLALFEQMIPNFESRKRSIALTHGDIDHAGILHLFDTIYVSGGCRDNFVFENNRELNWREQNRLHRPYSDLSKIISEYVPPKLSKLIVLGEKKDDGILTQIGQLTFADLEFDVYEGNGGHVKGETVFECKEHKLMFCGDIIVNIEGFSREQAEFNRLAPYLMQSVNVDSKKAKECREYLTSYAKGYRMCPGHGKIFMIET